MNFFSVLNKLKRRALVIGGGLLMMFLASSCSFLSPIKMQPEAAYVLTAAPHAVSHRYARPIVLLVSQPESTSLYDTTQMAYSMKHYEIAYFALNHWADTPAHMLYPLLVQTLQNTNYYNAVVIPPYLGRYHYLLRTQLIELVQDFTHHPAQLRFTVRVQLIDVAFKQRTKTKQFTVTQAILQRPPYGGVIAANQAMVKLLGQITRFCINNSASNHDVTSLDVGDSALNVKIDSDTTGTKG